MGLVSTDYMFILEIKNITLYILSVLAKMMKQLRGIPSKLVLRLVVVTAISHLGFAEPPPTANSCWTKSAAEEATKQACSGQERCYSAKFTTQANTNNYDIRQGCVSDGDDILKNARIQSNKLETCSNVASVGFGNKSPFSAICVCNSNDCNTKVRGTYTRLILK